MWQPVNQPLALWAIHFVGFFQKKQTRSRVSNVRAFHLLSPSRHCMLCSRGVTKVTVTLHKRLGQHLNNLDGNAKPSATEEPLAWCAPIAIWGQKIDRNSIRWEPRVMFVLSAVGCRDTHVKQRHTNNKHRPYCFKSSFSFSNQSRRCSWHLLNSKCMWLTCVGYILTWVSLIVWSYAMLYSHFFPAKVKLVVWTKHSVNIFYFVNTCYQRKNV